MYPGTPWLTINLLSGWRIKPFQKLQEKTMHLFTIRRIITTIQGMIVLALCGSLFYVALENERLQTRNQSLEKIYTAHEEIIHDLRGRVFILSSKVNKPNELIEKNTSLSVMKTRANQDEEYEPPPLPSNGGCIQPDYDPNTPNDGCSYLPLSHI
jgi:hypothetical protein